MARDGRLYLCFTPGDELSSRAPPRETHLRYHIVSQNNRSKADHRQIKDQGRTEGENTRLRHASWGIADDDQTHSLRGGGLQKISTIIATTWNNKTDKNDSLIYRGSDGDIQCSLDE